MAGLIRSVLASGLVATLAASAAWPQDQDITVVEELTSLRPMVPVPKVGDGAPYYSPEQLEGEARQAAKNFNCISGAARPGGRLAVGDPAEAPASDLALRRFDSQDHYNYFDDVGNAYRDGLADKRIAAPDRLVEQTNKRPGGLLPSPILIRVQSREAQIAGQARRAQAATQAAEETRRLAAQGKTTQQAVEESELARQQAVRAYDRLTARNFGPGYVPDAGDQTVRVQNAMARIEESAGGPMVRVAGRLINTAARTVPLPDLTATVFDLAGNRVTATAARGANATLNPKQGILFELKFPAGQDSATVQLTVGQNAPFLGDRDFCGSRKPELAAAAYWQEQDDSRFNIPPRVVAQNSEPPKPFIIEILQ